MHEVYPTIVARKKDAQVVMQAQKNTSNSEKGHPFVRQNLPERCSVERVVVVANRARERTRSTSVCETTFPAVVSAFVCAQGLDRQSSDEEKAVRDKRTPSRRVRKGLHTQQRHSLPLCLGGPLPYGGTPSINLNELSSTRNCKDGRKLRINHMSTRIRLKVVRDLSAHPFRSFSRQRIDT